MVSVVHLCTCCNEDKLLAKGMVSKEVVLTKFDSSVVSFLPPICLIS